VQLEEAPSKGSTVWAPVGAPLTALSGGPPNTYARRVIADGAVAYWRLAEKTAPVVDAIGGVTGTFVGGVAPGPGLLTDGNGALVLVDGSYVQLASPIPWKAIELWFRTSVGVNGATNYGFFDDRYNAVNGRQLRLNGDTGQLVMLSYVAGAPSAYFSGRAGLFDLRAHQIVVNNAGATFEFYIDGVLDNSGAAVAAGVATDAARIGQPAQSFIGTVDEVSVYSAALSPAQILAHYQLGVGTFAPPVVTGGLATARVVVPKAVYGALRMRVTTPIAGGPVTAWVVAGDIPAEEAA
jgi:hypothetical protein